MIVYEIKRGSQVLASVKPTGGRREGIMAGDVVNMSFKLNSYVDFLKGDTTIVDGELFILEKASDYEQDTTWNYNLNFLKDAELSRAGMLALDENNELSEYDSFFTGNASNAIDLIIANANRISPGFTKGTVDETEAKDFDFTGDNCATALAKLANAFNIEFWVQNKKIFLTKKGADSGLSFRKGKGKGLLKLIRKVQDTKVVTRLLVYGSKNNLPSTYPGLSKRLRMPGGQKYIQNQSKVDKYGLEEDSILLDDIFPKRVGKITAVAGALTFSDSAIDFDLNNHRVDKVAAKVKFITGRLAGYQFEVVEKGYNHSTKTITILVNKDETAMEVPSAASGMVPAVGDQYIFIDVIMPQIDITKAEIELKAKATERYNESSDPRVIYDAPTDRRFLRDFNIFVKLGDFVTIQAPEANVDQRIRVISKTTNLQDKYDVTLELSETVSVASIVKQLIAESNIQKAVKNAKITDIARQRLMWRTTTELTTMLDTLRAEMLLIMQEGGAYVTDVILETSVDQNPNKFRTDAGTVEHQEYIENGGTWNVPSFTGTVPTSAAYYIYIKASKTSNAATIVYSLNKLQVDGGVDYYFPYGILSSVIDGTRIFSSIHGYTRITGNNIKTGIIEGPSGALVINLQTGEIFGKVTFRGSNGAIKDIKNVDDIANLAIDNAAAANTKAIAAQTSANTANALLADIANDNLLVPSEKQDVLKEWRIIQSEKPVVVAQAGTYGLSTSLYDGAYNALNTYITPLLANMTTNSVIVATTFRDHFKIYYDNKVALLKAVSDSAKTIADAAQGTANTAITNAANAKVTADAAKLVADTAKVRLDDMTTDGILDPVEKVEVNKLKLEFNTEYPTIIANAAVYGAITTGYITAKSTLDTYLTPLLANMQVKSAIDRVVFNANFSKYYDERQKLLSTIAAAAKTLVDNIDVGGRNLLKDTARSIDTPNYLMVNYLLEAPLNEGVDHVFTLWGELGSDRTTFNIYNSGGSVLLSSLSKVSDGIYQAKFKWKIGSSSNQFVSLYQLVNGATSISKIKAVKLEKGTIGTGWSESPEETQRKIDAAKSAADQAKAAADSAQSSANTANSMLADIANDNLLTPSEKQDVLKEWQIIQGEKAYIEGQALTYAISTATYTSYYNALNTYITPLLAVMTVNSIIVGATFRSNFKSYYDSKVALLKLISDKAKQLSDDAQSTASTALVNAGAAKIAADNAKIVADAQKSRLDDMSADGILDPVEKKEVNKLRLEFNTEYPVIITNAGVYGVPSAAYASVKSALDAYTTPLLANMQVNSTIDRVAFNTNFTRYYDERQKLLSAIATAAKTLVDNIVIGGRNLARNSELNSLLGYSSNGGTQAIEVIDGVSVVRINASAAGQGVYSSQKFTTPVLPLTQYSVSFDIRMISYVANPFSIRVGIESGGTVFAPQVAGWQRVSYTFTTPAAVSQFLVIYSASAGANSFYIKNLKVEISSKATDWTEAPEDVQAKIDFAKLTADNARTAADNAQTIANTANSLLADIANDNLLIPSEKQDVLKEWQVIQGEKVYIEGQAATYGINSATYTSYYNALNTYITPLLSNLSVNSVIVATTFRLNFKSYYDAKIALLKLVTDAAKSLADAAQSTAATALTNAAAAKAVADTAQTNVALANSNIAAAKVRLDDMSADGILDPVEKKAALKDWQELEAMHVPLLADATLYGVSTSDVVNYRQALSTYLNPFFQNMNANSAIVRTTFNLNWSNYFGAKQKLQADISAIAKNTNKTILASTSTVFRDFFGLNVGTVIVGYLLIKTKIPYTSRMYNINIKGYNYVQGNANIDLSIGFYPYAPSLNVINTGFVSRGDFPISEVRILRESATGFATIALGTATTSWAYPSIAVESMIVSFANAEPGIEAGWIGTVQTALPANTSIAVVPAIVMESTAGATSKANQAKLDAVSAASTDAQTKATQAKNDAVTAANTYSNTVSNSAASAAEIRAAADALTKANAARDAAIASANTQYNNLTGQLKQTAYQDIEQWALSGNSVFQGGKLNVLLLDAPFIRANIVNAQYVQTLDLNASKITAGILSAARIDVENLIVLNLKTATTGRRVEITKAGNNISFFVDGSLNPTVVVDANIEASTGSAATSGMSVVTAVGISKVTGSGIFGNGSDVYAFGSASGFTANASIVGISFRRNTSQGANGVNAGIIGVDGNDASATGNSISCAAYFAGRLRFAGMLSEDIFRARVWAAQMPAGQLLMNQNMGTVFIDISGCTNQGLVLPVIFPKGREGDKIIIITNGSPYGTTISPIIRSSSINSSAGNRDTLAPHNSQAPGDTGLERTLKPYHTYEFQFMYTSPYDLGNLTGQWKLLRRTPDLTFAQAWT